MHRRRPAARVGRRPPWLYVALPILLTTMVMGAWLASLTSEDVRAPAAPAAERLPDPVVAYEAFRDAEAVAPVQRDTPILPPAHGIALIMDDVGYNLEAVRRVLRLPYPVAVSVLPFSPYAKKAAELAHRAGRVVMVHLPMEPASPDYRQRMDRGFLRADMSERAVRRLMLNALERVPFAVGINNHMGSRLTTMAEPMHWVMQVCRERSLFFVDSRTSKETVAAKEARAAGVNWGERRVFLDHRPDMEAIRASWDTARQLFQLQGSCIVIVHPYGETLNFLEALIPAHEQQHIVPVSTLLHTGGDT